MKRRWLGVTVAAAAMLLGGCASDFGRYAEATVRVQQSADSVRGKRFEALGALGCTTTYVFNDRGDRVTRQEVRCDPEAAKFAAFALAVAGANAAPEQAARLEAPYTLGQGIRDVAGLLVPLANVGATIYGAMKSADVAVAQSTNAANVAMSTNATFSNIAASGFAAATTLGSKPTVGAINGDGNALFGSTTTQTTTVNCPQTTTASTGHAGNGATGGAGGAGGNGGGTSSGGGQAGNGATGGAGGASGASMPQATVNCVAGRK